MYEHSGFDYLVFSGKPSPPLCKTKTAEVAVVSEGQSTLKQYLHPLRDIKAQYQQKRGE